ncbi:MAG TPA: FMN-binding negative transcriptional regulator [Pseudolabrys sp.]|nr:FMN-binding negative transcriptional regulator [Pseudolabrys sp.]
MYTPPAFKVHPAVALAFAAGRGFGLIVTCDGGRPVASHVPFLIEERPGKGPRVTFHVARGNPLAAAAEKRGTWLLATQGADAYVSAAWYASADQVPTWLYETVHLSGPVAVVPAEHARAHLEALSARFEQGIAEPWTMDKVSPPRLEQLMRAIVVIEMLVEDIEGKFKLNQHKTDADHIAIASQLSAQADPAAQTIAARMVALRPQLMYQTPESAPQAALADSGDM